MADEAADVLLEFEEALKRACDRNDGPAVRLQLSVMMGAIGFARRVGQITSPEADDWATRAHSWASLAPSWSGQPASN